MNEIIITCKSVNFYSMLDEDAFFYCIKKIQSIIKTTRKLDEEYLHFLNKNISDEDLRNLVGLFYRYKIKNVDQLQIFLNDKNENWFKNAKWGYYKNIWKNLKNS